MICKNCNEQIPDGSIYCTNCGAALEEPQPQTEEQALPTEPAYQQNTVYSQPQDYYSQPAEMTEEELPEKFKPLSPWVYFGLQILYSIPIVGIIFMIIFSISDGNINRRNFTRSYWIPFVIALVLVIIYIILAFFLFAGVSSFSGY